MAQFTVSPHSSTDGSQRKRRGTKPSRTRTKVLRREIPINASGSTNSSRTGSTRSGTSQERARNISGPPTQVEKSPSRASGSRRMTAPTKTREQRSSIIEETDDDAEGEQSESDSEVEGEELELISELGFTIVVRDAFGRPVAQRRWIVLDDAEIKRAKFFRPDKDDSDDDDNDNDDELYRLATEGLDHKIIPGTEVNRAPADEDLRPAFVALFDFADEVQQKCAEQEATLKKLRDAVEVFQRFGPATPDWIKQDEDAGQYGLEHKMRKQEKELARLREQFNKKINRREDSVVKGFEYHVQILQAENEKLRAENEKLLEKGRVAPSKDASTSPRSPKSEVSQSNLGLTRRLSTAHRELILAKRQKRDREVELDTERRKATYFVKQAQDMEKQLKLNREQLDQHMCEKLAGFEEEYPKVKEQRNQLKRMCFDSLQQLKEIAEWQRGQQKAQQVFFETEQAEALQQGQLLIESANDAVRVAESQRNTMDDLKELRQIGYPSTDASQQQDETLTTFGAIDTVKANTTTRKSRPTPIFTPPAPVHRLPEVARSPKELEGIPSTQSAQLPNQISLDEYPQAPDSPTLTALWEDYAKDPIQFISRARIVHDVVRRDKKHRKHLFKRDEKVFLFVDGMKDFWPVKRGEGKDEPQYMLHRTDLALICPHDYEYHERYLTIADGQLFSDVGEPLHPLTHGELVLCAHSRGTTFDECFPSVLIRCVQTENGEARGWVRAQMLQGLDRAYASSFSTSFGETCLCEQSRPYQGRATVLNACRAVDDAFSLSEDDILDVAHEGRPSSKGLLCVRHPTTRQRGYVAGVNLRVLKQPFAEELAGGHDRLVELTPRYFPVASETWIGGEEMPFQVAQGQRPVRRWFSRSELPFSQDAKQAWVNGTQGTNPCNLSWTEAEARSRPMRVMDDLDNEYDDPGKYVTLADHLTIRPGDDLPRNPYGPSTGIRRARSLSVVNQREKRVLKHGPHIGFQPERTSLGDSEVSDRGYDSEPISDEAKSKVKKNSLFKKIDGTMQVIDASDEVNVHDLDIWQENGGQSSKYGNQAEGRVRCMDGSRYARGPDFVSRALSLQRRGSPEIETIGDSARSATGASTDVHNPGLPPHTGADNQALTEIIKDMGLGYALVYGLQSDSSPTESSHPQLTAKIRFELETHEAVGLVIEENGDLIAHRVPTEGSVQDDSAGPAVMFVAPHDLDWSSPYLQSANSRYGKAVLMRRSSRVDGWHCYFVDKGMRGDLGVGDLKLLPVQEWPTLMSFRKALAQKQQPLAGPAKENQAVRTDHAAIESASERPEIKEAHPSYRKGQWEGLFPVTRTQAKDDPSLVRVDAGDWVYQWQDSTKDHYQCEVFSSGERGWIAKSHVDTDPASLVFPYYPVKRDLGFHENSVIVLKRKIEAGLVFCGLSDKSKRWLYSDELPFDLDNIQMVTLFDLVKYGYLQMDDEETLDDEVETKKMRRETEVQPTMADQPTQETQNQRLQPNPVSVEAPVSPEPPRARPSAMHHQDSSVSQLAAQAYPSPALTEDGNIGLGIRGVPLDVQGTTERGAFGEPRNNTTHGRSENTWGFHNIITTADTPPMESDTPAEPSESALEARPASEEDGHSSDSTEQSIEGDVIDVVPYPDYKEVKDATKTRPDTVQGSTATESAPVSVAEAGDEEEIKDEGVKFNNIRAVPCFQDPFGDLRIDEAHNQPIGFGFLHDEPSRDGQPQSEAPPPPAREQDILHHHDAVEQPAPAFKRMFSGLSGQQSPSKRSPTTTRPFRLQRDKPSGSLKSRLDKGLPRRILIPKTRKTGMNPSGPTGIRHKHPPLNAILNERYSPRTWAGMSPRRRRLVEMHYKAYLKHLEREGLRLNHEEDRLPPLEHSQNTLLKVSPLSTPGLSGTQQDASLTADGRPPSAKEHVPTIVISLISAPISASSGASFAFSQPESTLSNATSPELEPLVEQHVPEEVSSPISAPISESSNGSFRLSQPESTLSDASSPEPDSVFSPPVSALTNATSIAETPMPSPPSSARSDLARTRRDLAPSAVSPTDRRPLPSELSNSSVVSSARNSVFSPPMSALTNATSIPESPMLSPPSSTESDPVRGQGNPASPAVPRILERRVPSPLANSTGLVSPRASPLSSTNTSPSLPTIAHQLARQKQNVQPDSTASTPAIPDEPRSTARTSGASDVASSTLSPVQSKPLPSPLSNSSAVKSPGASSVHSTSTPPSPHAMARTVVGEENLAPPDSTTSTPRSSDWSESAVSTPGGSAWTDSASSTSRDPDYTDSTTSTPRTSDIRPPLSTPLSVSESITEAAAAPNGSSTSPWRHLPEPLLLHLIGFILWIRQVYDGLTSLWKADYTHALLSGLSAWIFAVAYFVISAAYPSILRSARRLLSSYSYRMPPLDKKAVGQTVYLAGLIYLGLGMIYAREQWLGANGLDRGVRLVRSQRATYNGGGWEWGPWEALKGMMLNFA
ncbi:hypothetical protein PMZ80_009770 [Knufia obscura]|uniref:Uncharacterized protein n=1 Tax=Knufia obscura TaxID=1635080 RepID=A0ABR0RC60_9EURO|nr:hypothetical protein PMZ80_009770 [Knufia obscura]